MAIVEKTAVGDNWYPLDAFPLDKKEAAQHLSSNYRNPAHPIAFMGIDKIYKYYNGKLSKRYIMNKLSSIEAYTLMKQEKVNPKKIWTPIISFHYLDLGLNKFEYALAN